MKLQFTLRLVGYLIWLALGTSTLEKLGEQYAGHQTWYVPFLFP